MHTLGQVKEEGNRHLQKGDKPQQNGGGPTVPQKKDRCGCLKGEGGETTLTDLSRTNTTDSGPKNGKVKKGTVLIKKRRKGKTQ